MEHWKQNLVEHAGDGELALTENQVRKLRVYAASRRPLGAVRRKAAALTATAIISATTLLGAAMPAAANDTTPPPTNTISATVDSRADGPFVKPRGRGDAEFCPPGYERAAVTKNIKNATHVKWNSRPFKKKRLAKRALAAGATTCAIPKSNTPQTTPGAKRTLPGQFQVSRNSAGEVTISAASQRRLWDGATAADVQELVRQANGNPIAKDVFGGVWAKGAPLVRAEAPDSVDLVSVERGADGQLYGNWVVRGGWGLAKTTGNYQRLAGPGTETMIKQRLQLHTTVNGATIAEMRPFVVDDYGHGGAPIGTFGTSFDRTISVTSKLGYRGSTTAGDHRAAVNPDTLEVLQNIDGSGEALSR